MASTERRIGFVAVDTAQLLILDPTNLVDDTERDRVFAAGDRGDGAVWLSDPPGGLPDPPDDDVADGILIQTVADGTFPVLVTYDDDGEPTSVRIELRATKGERQRNSASE